MYRCGVADVRKDVFDKAPAGLASANRL